MIKPYKLDLQELKHVNLFEGNDFTLNYLEN